MSAHVEISRWWGARDTCTAVNAVDIGEETMSAEVDYRLSGGAANSDPNASLGGAISSVSIDSNANPNLFANVTTEEAGLGSDKYRCIFITPPSKNYTGVSIWIDTQTLSNDTAIHLAVAPEGKNADTQLLGNENSAPIDVIFTRPTQDYAALALPDLDSGDRIGIWIKRTVDSGAAGFPNDYGRIVVEGTEV